MVVIRQESHGEITNSTRGLNGYLADASSLANSGGGWLVFGVEESGGAATNLSGVPSLDTDKDILRLESLLRDGLAPRLPGVSIRAVGSFDSGPAFVLRIPQSWSGPHLVSLSGSSRFYARNSAGKYQLDVQEIRGAFAASAGQSSALRDFRTRRLGLVLADESPVVLKYSGRVVLHLVPASALAPNGRVDVRVAAQHRTLTYPLDATGYNHRYNADGYLTHCEWRPSHDQPPEYVAYMQTFRSGAIETVNATLVQKHEGVLTLPSARVEAKVIEATTNYLRLMTELGSEGPIVAAVSLFGVKGAKLAVRRDLWGGEPIDKDPLFLPEVVFEGLPQGDQPERAVGRAFRPSFDAMWQAAGWRECFDYEDSGDWAFHGQI